MKATTHSRLKARCASLGLTIREMCQRAGVKEATFASWASAEPGTLVTLSKLEGALDQFEAAKNSDQA